MTSPLERVGFYLLQRIIEKVVFVADVLHFDFHQHLLSHLHRSAIVSVQSRAVG
jgi:hypothetical protein